MITRLSIFSLIVLLAACGDDKQQSTGDNSSSGASASSGESEGDSTIGMSSTPTTGDDPVMTGSDSKASDSGTTTDDSAGGLTTTGLPDTTTASGTTGGVDPEIAQRCADVCGKFIECKVMDNLDTCTQDCLDNFGQTEGACLAAGDDALACVAGMTCEQVQNLMLNDDPGPCAPQFEAQSMACAGNECTGSVGGNEQGTECSVSTDCPGDPLLEMNCDTVTCTCLSGGEKTGECPADGVCMSVDLLDAKSQACCGF